MNPYFQNAHEYFRTLQQTIDEIFNDPEKREQFNNNTEICANRTARANETRPCPPESIGTIRLSNEECLQLMESLPKEIKNQTNYTISNVPFQGLTELYSRKPTNNDCDALIVDKNDNKTIELFTGNFSTIRPQATVMYSVTAAAEKDCLERLKNLTTTNSNDVRPTLNGWYDIIINIGGQGLTDTQGNLAKPSYANITEINEKNQYIPQIEAAVDKNGHIIGTPQLTGELISKPTSPEDTIPVTDELEIKNISDLIQTQQYSTVSVIPKTKTGAAVFINSYKYRPNENNSIPPQKDPAYFIQNIRSAIENAQEKYSQYPPSLQDNFHKEKIKTLKEYITKSLEEMGLENDFDINIKTVDKSVSAEISKTQPAQTFEELKNRARTAETTKNTSPINSHTPNTKQENEMEL